MHIVRSMRRKGDKGKLLKKTMGQYNNQENATKDTGKARKQSFYASGSARFKALQLVRRGRKRWYRKRGGVWQGGARRQRRN